MVAFPTIAFGIFLEAQKPPRSTRPPSCAIHEQDFYIPSQCVPASRGALQTKALFEPFQLQHVKSAKG